MKKNLKIKLKKDLLLKPMKRRKRRKFLKKTEKTYKIPNLNQKLNQKYCNRPLSK